MNGYVVESFADASMRVRAWFENEDDAREYAGKLGASAYMHAGEASYEVAADVAGRVEELDTQVKEIRAAVAVRVTDDIEDEIADLESEIEDLQDRLHTLRSKKRAA